PTSTPSLAVAWGSGTPVSLAIAADGTAIITRPASAPGDANRLVIRTRAGTFDGPNFSFRVQPLGGALPARLYYALDQSPAPASSPFFDLTEAQRLAPSDLTLDLGSASPGFHTLHLQLHDTQGGRTEQLRHLHITPSRVQTLVGLAYTFKPAGDGAPIDIELAPLTSSPEPQDIALPVPASLPAGAYTLVLHLANTHADLGSASTADLFLGGAYDIWAADALAGRDPSETGPLADPDQDQLVNLLEYAFGLDPLQPAASAAYSIQSQTTPAGAPSLLVEYRQREGGAGELGVDYIAGGLRYTVEGSTDLQTWVPYSELPSIGSYSSRHTNGDGTETVQLEVLYEQTLDSAKRVFLRLKVSVVP
ncbi:MAG: hypothetical protein H7067_00575, partial [Burkholderiales bacterium]|nr:hypothetical protein [Opitutaceae bacterium]